MNFLYFTLPDRKSIKTLRLEYGQLVLKFVLDEFQPTPIPSNLNTIQKDQPDQRNQTPTPNGQRGIQRGERVIWMNQDGLEKSRISGGERGVLRVGMVSEGGECGSQYPTFFLQDRENVW
jgi:hypothetical protein